MKYKVLLKKVFKNKILIKPTYFYLVSGASAQDSTRMDGSTTLFMIKSEKEKPVSVMRSKISTIDEGWVRVGLASFYNKDEI